ncbi:MAG: branched-chain amino acid transaminase [Gemmatimonas sp.]|jgi:branched-chain amino acid aminotransferase
MSAFTKVEYIWKNGELVRWDDANTHLTAHVVHYGTGVFEGMRSYPTDKGPAIFRLKEHMNRLAMSAKFYELHLPYTVQQLCDASLELMRANKLESAYFRPLAYFDSYSFSVWPKDFPVSVAIMAVPGKAYIQGGPEHGVRATVSTIRRIDASTLPAFVKACGHYTNSVRAVQEAIRRGFDEAILLNHKGEVAEGSGANLFVVRNGTLITNDLEASILPGITRDAVLTIARDAGVPVEVRPITTFDLEVAEEVFFSGTAVEITPIKEVDGRVVGEGKPGPVTKKLQGIFHDTVRGKLPQYSSWLTHA